MFDYGTQTYETTTHNSIKDFLLPIKYISKRCTGENKALSIFKVEDDLERALKLEGKEILNYVSS